MKTKKCTRCNLEKSFDEYYKCSAARLGVQAACVSCMTGKERKVSTSMRNEVWKDIPGYEGFYQASDLGRIKSLPKMKFNGKADCLMREKIRTGSGNHYFNVCLATPFRKLTIYNVHQLIAMAFYNFNPKDDFNMIVDHINNNRFDNRLSNLQIVDRRENNSKDRKNKTSIFTGVYFEKRTKSYRAEINIKKTPIFIGLSKDECLAALYYNVALENEHLFNGDKNEFRNLVKEKSCLKYAS